jgi:hypothetical protein
MPLLLAETTLDSPAIRQAARNVVSRPYFELDSRSPRDHTPLILEIIRWLLTPFRWLFENMEGLPEAVRWLVVIACFILCVALIAHILYTLLAAIRAPVLYRKLQLESTKKEADPSDLEQKADAAVARQDYIGAVRLLFRATLRRLELFEKKKFRPGITNRELLSRYRSSPVAESLSRFVNTIDFKWYGQMPCGEADYLSCRDEHGRICRFIVGSTPAERA